MKELLEMRMVVPYNELLFSPDEGTGTGDIKKVVIDTSLPIYKEVEKVYNELRKEGKYLFHGWNIERIYTKEEMQEAPFFQIIPKIFTFAGEECGTKYDDSHACPICGSGGKIIPPLKMWRSRIPKTDISITLGRGEEILVSERFKRIMEENHMRGLRFEPVFSGRKQIDYFQLLPEYYTELSEKTVLGAMPFDYSERDEGMIVQYPDGHGGVYKQVYPPEVFKCPNGDNMGLNVLSEAYIKENSALEDWDYFASVQTVGVKRKLFRPYHLLFCSNRMMNIIKENKLKGFKFEIARVTES